MPESEGGGLPHYVEREIAAYVRCGQLACGSARVRCVGVGTRSWSHSVASDADLPSCAARGVADTAAHLVDRVLPRAPDRQWAFTMPTGCGWCSPAIRRGRGESAGVSFGRPSVFGHDATLTCPARRNVLGAGSSRPTRRCDRTSTDIALSDPQPVGRRGPRTGRARTRFVTLARHGRGARGIRGLAVPGSLEPVD